MQYNSHATSQDCVSEINQICGADASSYPIAAKTRRFNFALDRYFELAFQADGRWKFDDANQTDVPLESLNLVSGTNKYDMSTLTSELFMLFRVEALDSNDNPVLLEPESFEALNNDGLTFNAAYSTASNNQGVPSRYLKWGDFIYLRQTPNYSKTSGLKFYFNRKASYMVTTDTTKVPGVPVIHHKFLCRYASLPYLIEKRLPQANAISQQIAQDEAELLAHFSRRELDAPKTLRPLTNYPKR